MRQGVLSLQKPAETRRLRGASEENGASAHSSDVFGFSSTYATFSLRQSLTTRAQHKISSLASSTWRCWSAVSPAIPQGALLERTAGLRAWEHVLQGGTSQTTR